MGGEGDRRDRGAGLVERSPWWKRLRYAWAVLRGDAVMVGVKLIPWAGPAPSDGPNPEGWVYVDVAFGGDNLFALDVVFGNPVIVFNGNLDIPDDGLPYVWRPEE